MIQGSCLCGAVRFALTKSPDLMSLCHCGMCRKATGSAYGVFAHTRRENFRWTAGEDHVSRYASSPDNERAFCATCGSNVPVIEADGSVIVPAGSLDDDPGVRPLVQIFCGSKASWHDLAESPVHFAAFPPQDWSPGEASTR